MSSSLALPIIVPFHSQQFSSLFKRFFFYSSSDQIHTEDVWMSNCPALA